MKDETTVCEMWAKAELKIGHIIIIKLEAEKSSFILTKMWTLFSTDLLMKNLMLAQEEKLREQQSQTVLSTGDHESANNEVQLYI